VGPPTSARQGHNPRLFSFLESCFNMMIRSEEIIENLWAVPGLTSYLLNIDITSDQIKQSKMKDPEYSPSFHMLGTDEFQPEYQLNSDFCNVIGNILVGASFKVACDYTGAVVGAGLRQTPLATAAGRKVMAWMQDPCMLASMPAHCDGFGPDEDHLRARDTAFPKLLKGMLEDLPGDPDNPSAIAPGLTIEGAVRAIRNHIALDESRVRLDDLESILTSLEETGKKRWLGRLSLFFVAHN
jgi:hypothetical protein